MFYGVLHMKKCTCTIVSIFKLTNIETKAIYWTQDTERKKQHKN